MLSPADHPVAYSFHSPAHVSWFGYWVHKCPFQSYHLWEHASCPSDVTHGAWSQHVCSLCFQSDFPPHDASWSLKQKDLCWSHSSALQAVLGVSNRGTTQWQPPQESLSTVGRRTLRLCVVQPSCSSISVKYFHHCRNVRTSNHETSLWWIEQ